MLNFCSVFVMSESHLKIITLKIKVNRKFSFKVETENIQEEDKLMNMIRPELNKICFNGIRASILHLLFNKKDLGYCMSVERLSHKLGKRHSVILYHLEKLEKWRIVKVVKKYNHGDIERRSIWGLNKNFPNLVSEVYSYMLRTFYTMEELEDMCSVNLNVRKAA